MDIVLKEVRTRKDLKRFIFLPAKIHAGRDRGRRERGTGVTGGLEPYVDSATCAIIGGARVLVGAGWKELPETLCARSIRQKDSISLQSYTRIGAESRWLTI